MFSLKILITLGIHWKIQTLHNTLLSKLLGGECSIAEMKVYDVEQQKLPEIKDGYEDHTGEQ
ncbi:MAG: hypothetical protein LBD15_02725 [Holosporales bacterium]|jgi:hypothetical protein|nr:hypothetical protein [Holosporales bacterium]